MTNGKTLSSAVVYTGRANSAYWEGRVVDDVGQFRNYMHATVRHRVADSASSFATDLNSLAAAGMETQFVEKLLNSVPATEDWEVGEALAECALRDDSGRQVHWPWNTVRDRRTPRASLPGADLVGFCCEDDKVTLLFGEVKTSGDTTTPPRVMTGKSGMTWQLVQSATRLDVQHALLKWLHARCKDQPNRDLYEKAVKRYLESEGEDVLLVGVLLRDTAPNEHDLKAQGNSLSNYFSGPGRVKLLAWYLPVSIATWPTLL